MAEVVGQNGLHNIRGFLCDLCGRDCDPEAEELNALDCTFGNCPKDAAVYHQDCLEKYLKSIRLEKSRKTGFRCPRGTGKGSRFLEQPCPGKIDKSHPIHIRNDNAKKRRKAQMPVQLPDTRPKLDPKDKYKAKEEEAKRLKERKAKEEGAKSKAGTKVAKALSKEEQARQHKLRLQAAAQAMRRDLGLTIDSGPAKAASVTLFKPATASREPQTLEEYEAARAGLSRPSAPVSNPWSASKAAAVRQTAEEPPNASLQRPQVQQINSGWAATAAGPPPPPPARKIPPPAQHLAGPALKLSKGEEKGKGLPIGMEPASPPREEGHKLSKAQRKNLRRTEKKAAERNTEKMSVASSELISELDMVSIDGDALSEIPVIEEEETFFTSLQDECAQAITLFKAQCLIGQLQVLGFPDWQCVAAIMTHGSNLEDAVTFLLEGNAETEEQAHQILHASNHLPQIDISEELAYLQAHKEEFQLDLGGLQEMVVKFQGDVEKACNGTLDHDDTDDAVVAPSSPVTQERHPSRTIPDRNSTNLQASFAKLALHEGEQWSDQGVVNGPFSSHTEAAQGWNARSSWDNNSHYGNHSRTGPPGFEPAASRPVGVDHINELLGFPSVNSHQATRSFQCEPGLSQLSRQPQSAHPNESIPRTHTYSDWNPPGSLSGLYAPEAALYAAASVTDPSNRQSQEHADLDIDNLLASLIAH